MHPHDIQTGAIVNAGSFEDKRDDDISLRERNECCDNMETRPRRYKNLINLLRLVLRIQHDTRELPIK